MKAYIIIFFALSLSMLACTKKPADCDSSIKPTIIADTTVIAGDSLKLSVTGVDKGDIFIYNWYGPSGFSSHDSAPSIPGATSNNAGRYSVDIITTSGCIYSATSDSIRVGAPTIPCSLTNNTADLGSAGTYSFYYVSMTPGSGAYEIEANGYNGDADIQIFGTPHTGIYKIASDPTDMNPGEMQLYVNDGFSDWNAQPGGTVYVSVTNGKVSLSACSLSFISDAFGYKTTGSLEITTP